MIDEQDSPEALPVANAPDAPRPHWLDQNQASDLLETLGVKLAPKTLQKRRVVGGSPPFRKVMGRVLYERDELMAWAAVQVESAPRVSSTSEFASARISR